jgi:hypothetical protein
MPLFLTGAVQVKMRVGAAIMRVAMTVKFPSAQARDHRP